MGVSSYYNVTPPPQGPFEMPGYVPAPPPEHRRYTPSLFSEGPPPYSPGIPVPPTPQQQYKQQNRSPSYPAPTSAPYHYPQQYSSSPSKQPYPPYQPQPSSAPYPQPYPAQYSGAPYPQRQQPPPQVYPPQGGLYPPGQNPQRAYAVDNGYYSDPEPERRRHHHHKHHDKRPRSRDERSKSGNRNAVLGATGGALIGDLIFPGLGTVVVGGLGGWYAGKKIDKADKDYDRIQSRRSPRNS